MRRKGLMKINNCTNCGGRVEFSPNDKALKCINCGNVYPIKHNKTVSKHSIDWIPPVEQLQQWSKENHSFKCQTCGAQVAFNRYDIATHCNYCGANSLMSSDELPGLKPEIVVPFKISKEDAKTEFYNRVKKRNFLPLDFKKNLPRAEFGATYISSFNFAMFVSAEYKGTQRITRTERDSRGNSRTVTEYRHFSGKIDNQFNNILVEASDKLSQNDIRSVLPYDFEESYDYNDDFVKGYNVGYYNQSVDNAEHVAKQEAYNSIENMIRNRYSSISSLTITPTYSNICYNYALLPIYFITFRYKEKSYTNVMNGQTAKTAGNVPRSGLQITMLVLFILAIIGIPMLIILLNM